MAKPNTVNPVDAVDAVFENCKTADSRTPEVLTSVLETLKELKTDGAGPPLTQAARICADASREEDWRTPLGESGIVSFFQDILSHVSEDQELGRHCLRLIGNSCADNDENRRRVIDHPDSLKSVIKSTKNPELCPVATVVLYNICLGHEPSQLKAISDGACTLLLEAISREGFLEDEDIELDYFGRILETLFSHDAGKSSCPPSSLATLISLASSPHCSFDDFLTLLTLLSTLLSTSEFQQQLIVSDLVPRTLDLLEKFYSLALDPDSEKQDEKLIIYARNALVENIGDVSSQDSFLATYPLSSPTIARVRSWLNETDEGKVDLVVTACLIFGNVGRSDEVCGALAKEYSVHKDLLDIIRRTVRKYNDAVKKARKDAGTSAAEGEKKEGAGKGAVAVGVLHAATGVLKNLAIAKGNKEVLGPDGALDLVREMLGMEGVGVGQVWYSAVGFGRLVCLNCIGNVKLLLQLSSMEKPLLAEFLRIYAAAEELPTKTEIARTIAAVLRTLNTSPTSASPSTPAYPDLETTLYTHPIARPLWDMILQDKWPVVRSEGLFALALMARGAAEKVWVECGKAEEKVLRGLGGKDLDNSVILVAEVRNRLGGEVEDRIEELLVALVEKREKGVQKDVEVRLPGTSHLQKASNP